MNPAQDSHPSRSNRAVWWFATSLAIVHWLVQISSPVRSSSSAAFFVTGRIICAECMILSLWKRQWAWRWVAALTVSFLITVVSRILFYDLRNPMSQRLWPFEILYTGAVAGPSSLLGTLAGLFISWIMGRRGRPTEDANG